MQIKKEFKYYENYDIEVMDSRFLEYIYEVCHTYGLKVLDKIFLVESYTDYLDFKPYDKQKEVHYNGEANAVALTENGIINAVISYRKGNYYYSTDKRLKEKGDHKFVRSSSLKDILRKIKLHSTRLPSGNKPITTAEILGLDIHNRQNPIGAKIQADYVDTASIKRDYNSISMNGAELHQLLVYSLKDKTIELSDSYKQKLDKFDKLFDDINLGLTNIQNDLAKPFYVFIKQPMIHGNACVIFKAKLDEQYKSLQVVGEVKGYENIEDFEDFDKVKSKLLMWSLEIENKHSNKSGFSWLIDKVIPKIDDYIFNSDKDKIDAVEFGVGALKIQHNTWQMYATYVIDDN